jgi:hypothetical protein
LEEVENTKYKMNSSKFFDPKSRFHFAIGVKGGALLPKKPQSKKEDALTTAQLTENFRNSGEGIGGAKNEGLDFGSASKRKGLKQIDAKEIGHQSADIGTTFTARNKVVAFTPAKKTKDGKPTSPTKSPAKNLAQQARDETEVYPEIESIGAIENGVIPVGKQNTSQIEPTEHEEEKNLDPLQTTGKKILDDVVPVGSQSPDRSNVTQTRGQSHFSQTDKIIPTKSRRKTRPRLVRQKRCQYRGHRQYRDHICNHC